MGSELSPDQRRDGTGQTTAFRPGVEGVAFGHCRLVCFVYRSGMASTHVTLNDEAYRLLRKLKQRGESFSDVILRSVHRRADTFGELLDYAEQDPPPQLDMALMENHLKQRKRRSKR